ncbi:MAG TPA: SAM-dependent methyltransferase [Acidimicrobiales bacterium]
MTGPGPEAEPEAEAEPEPAPAPAPERRAERRLPPVGVTGVGVAVLRAVESGRPDRLFDDPYATAFVKAAGMGHRVEERAREGPGIAEWIATRTRFLDDVVLGACADGCAQVVILGAGLDARAFRLQWPEGTRLWELDLPDVLDFKEQVINAEGWRPRSARVGVPVDLSEDWGQALVGTGFDPAVPVAWLAEGLLAYLPTEIRDGLVARTAGLSVQGSRLGLTLASPHRLAAWQEAHPEGRSVPRDYVALWQSEAPEDVEGWLSSFGWQATVFDSAERSGAYGRPLDEGAVRPGARLIEATRR